MFPFLSLPLRSFPFIWPQWGSPGPPITLDQVEIPGYYELTSAMVPGEYISGPIFVSEIFIIDDIVVQSKYISGISTVNKIYNTGGVEIQ